MANFRTHFAVGAAVSGAASCGMLALNHISSTEAMVAFSLGTLGGFMPDLDSDNSTPVTITFNALALVTAFIVVFNKAHVLSIAEMLVLWVAVYLLMRMALSKSFQLTTVHRGMFHSVPAALLAGVLTANTMTYFFEQTGLLSWIYGCFMTMGYFVHLILDEMVSVNMMGRKVKRSLGTALKFYDPKNWFVTALVYGGLVFALMLAPEHQSALALLTESNVFGQLSTILWPQGQWFSGLFYSGQL